VIHDELGQALTALKLDLGWLQRQLRQDQRALVAKINTTMKHIDDTVRNVQRIS
jgi:signal transduction histidine kinase